MRMEKRSCLQPDQLGEGSVLLTLLSSFWSSSSSVNNKNLPDRRSASSREVKHVCQ